jgi:hypothetical protein
MCQQAVADDGVTSDCAHYFHRTCADVLARLHAVCTTCTNMRVNLCGLCRRPEECVVLDQLVCRDTREAPCGHTFHRDCYAVLGRGRFTCPGCAEQNPGLVRPDSRLLAIRRPVSTIAISELKRSDSLPIIEDTPDDKVSNDALEPPPSPSYGPLSPSYVDPDPVPEVAVEPAEAKSAVIAVGQSEAKSADAAVAPLPTARSRFRSPWQCQCRSAQRPSPPTPPCAGP